ncbi:MAG TPA: ADP-glyceromanno-heptose 6-epimerase [Acidisphaera sp.]|nr:ADP-glyceromanno-heptose 6-epimerase [Acidisphaera sp.]
MILVTGGAGFIGSFIQAELAARGYQTVVIDRLGEGDKWRNLAKHPPDRLLPPAELDGFLAETPPIEAVLHLGAISDTTARDGDLAWATNVELSRKLWHWCAAHAVRLIYASSAATYGDGAQGFEDDASLDHLARLRPLNLYGWTKHAFDLFVARAIARGETLPPQWVGLKFFNVFGPNEYHKRNMVSVVKVKHDEIAAGRAPRLFRSCVPGLADGEQRRDFIWVGDVADVVLWLLSAPHVSGLFNVGTGQARTYLDLAHAVCDAAGVARAVEFIDMPDALRGQYQSFTQAPMQRLRDAGYAREFTPLEEGVRLYVQRYLRTGDPYA